MKTRSRYVFSAAVAGLAMNALPAVLHFNEAQGATVAQFTFEAFTNAGSTTGTGFGTYTADGGVNAGSAFAQGKHTFTTATGITSTTWSSPGGNGSLRSLSGNRWSANDYYEFDINTTSFQDLVASFDTTSSGTGPRFFTFFYSTDGTNYSSFGTYTIVTTAGFSSGTPTTTFSVSFDLSAITDLNNNANAKFRLVDTDSTNATGGTNRVDNFVISGNAAGGVPEPASVSLLTVAAASTLLRRRRQA